MSRSGFGVGKSRKPKSRISRTPCWFSPKISPSAHRVVGRIPSADSDKKCLSRGARSPLGPHQILLSRSRAANPAGFRLQHLFGGGMNFFPLGDFTSKMFSDLPV